MTTKRRGSNSKRGPKTERLRGPSLDHEERLHALGIRPVAGVDEAGRGPLAGPVVAAAVAFAAFIPLVFKETVSAGTPALTP